MKLRFNLKQVREEDRPTQIMLVITANHRRVRVYTGLRVAPKCWNSELSRPNGAGQQTLRERMLLKQMSEQMDRLVKSLRDADDRLAEAGKVLTASGIRLTVKEWRERESLPQNPVECLRRIAEGYGEGLNRHGLRGNGDTRRAYLSAVRRLEQYNRQRRSPIESFSEFGIDFFADFRNYLSRHTYGKQKKHYTEMTVVNTLKVLKNLLHRAYDCELTTNNSFTKVQTVLPSNLSEQVYLDEHEIRRFARVPTASAYERAVRDMFVVACYTALRFSDIQQLDEAVIKEKTITLFQQKTKVKIGIPILKEIVSLVARYQQRGFPKLRRNNVNATLRQLAARCHIDELVTHKEVRGGEISIKTTPKHELVSFHTARRSCITNLYLRGYPANYIMSLSGHRSFQSFQRYIKASGEEVMQQFIRKLKEDNAI